MTELLEVISQLTDINLIHAAMGLVTLIFIAAISFFLVRQIVLKMIRHAVTRTKGKWDDALIKRKVFGQISFLVPAIVFYFGLTFLTFSTELLGRVILAYIVINIVIVISRILAAALDIYQAYEISIARPIKGYVQLLNMVVYLLGGALAICTLLAISPWGILSGLGAVTALLILVFRDTILSIIASIQIAAYDLVRRGDWIAMPQIGVDGDVVDVALHTVRVQNWDKTIVTVPTHKLIQESFKNWRGMTEAGGRRIKRSILIDLTSIRFLDRQDLERLSEVNRLKAYLTRKKVELDDASSTVAGEGHRLNERMLTNIGTFRAYIDIYLKENNKIHKEMTFLVRQLPPSPHGLPLELYVFTNDTDWGAYEAIQADIFDHLLSSLPAFDLRVFQHPTGFDMQNLLSVSPQDEIGK